jgi:AcrR family transcriptional regulator
MAAATRPRLDRRTRAARAQALDGREALLEAAARVFVRRGYRDASVEEIAREAGFSKGAVYWHFDGKEDLFYALAEQRINAPVREMIELLRSAPPERDMSVEANQRFVELLERQRELLLLDQEYWSLAVREPQLRARYAARQAEVRTALGEALQARVRHLGAPVEDVPVQDVATAVLALANGLGMERLIDPDAVPDDLLGRIILLVYTGLVARAPSQSRPDGLPRPQAGQ